MSIALLAKAEWDHTAWEAPRALLLTQDVPMHMFQIWKEIMLVEFGRLSIGRKVAFQREKALHQPAKKVLMSAAADAQAWEAAVALLDAMRQAGGAMVWDDE